MKCPNCDGDLVEDERDSTVYVCHCCYVALYANELAQHWQERCEQAETRANERANRARILFRRLREAKFSIHGWVIRYNIMVKACEEAIQRRDEARRERDKAEAEANDWQIRYRERVKLHEALQKMLIESENDDEMS